MGGGGGSRDQFIQGLGVLIQLAQFLSPPVLSPLPSGITSVSPWCSGLPEGQVSSLFPGLLMTNSRETEALPSTLGGDTCSHAARSLLGPWKAGFFFGCEFPREVAILRPASGHSCSPNGG